WAPALLAIALGAVVVALMLVWAVLASVYCWLAWLGGFFANRELIFRGAWRLAGAALMPGALVMSGAIVLYGLAALDLMRLTLAFAVHLVIGWVYLFLSLPFLPRHPEVAGVKKN